MVDEESGDQVMMKSTDHSCIFFYIDTSVPDLTKLDANYTPSNLISTFCVSSTCGSLSPSPSCLKVSPVLACQVSSKSAVKGMTSISCESWSNQPGNSGREISLRVGEREEEKEREREKERKKEREREDAREWIGLAVASSLASYA